MGTTAHGLPYPDPADLVANTDEYIADLAEATDVMVPKASGVFVGDTDASGEILIPHGLGYTPTVVLVQVRFATAYQAFPMVADDTYLTVRIRNLADASNPPDFLASSEVYVTWVVFA